MSDEAKDTKGTDEMLSEAPDGEKSNETPLQEDVLRRAGRNDTEAGDSLRKHWELREATAEREGQAISRPRRL